MVDVWPVALGEPLPTIPVPLAAGDDDVALDLQQAFDNVYDLRGFNLLIDYGEPPEVPLESGEAEWARGILDAASRHRADLARV